MGSSFSTLIPCLNPTTTTTTSNHHPTTTTFIPDNPLDETLGHSFCYSRFLSPSHSFRTISGASLSANPSTPPSLQPHYSTLLPFHCTPSFSAFPLHPVPPSHSNSGFFLSGPIERGGSLSGPFDDVTHDIIPFSAPLGGGKKKKSEGLGRIKRALLLHHRSFSEKKQRPWVVPVSRGTEFVVREGEGACSVQWALGKAGEDRVHVVVSEEHGWLFVGIYDGFNGPDAPEFLMGRLYRTVFSELQGLFWDARDCRSDNCDGNGSSNNDNDNSSSGGKIDSMVGRGEGCSEIVNDGEEENRAVGVVKRMTFESEKKEVRRKLWEFLAEDEEEDGLDLSGSDRFAFSVDDAVRVSNVGSTVSRRTLLSSRLKSGLTWTKDGHNKGFFPWRFGVDDHNKVDVDNRLEEEEERSNTNGRRRKRGPVNHELVLKALSQALEKTEQAYLDLTEKVIDRYPELALMGSCLLVVLMRDEDVYVMNVGDSRAIVAQVEHEESCSSSRSKEADNGCSNEGVVEEIIACDEKASSAADELPAQFVKLTALQLSTDHSTSIEQEVIRIKNEHPDDDQCIVNDRVKGRLKVTRAFGAGFLKRPKLNDAVLEMFRNDFIGDAPYIACMPSLCHHKLSPRDKFLVLSSDGLYQYLSNQEVVSYVDNFMEKFPDGDPAQHLIEELLNRAAKKAGMNFHELLDIPQGDRRKYHDDVTVMVISLEGRIWKSSGKYP